MARKLFTVKNPEIITACPICRNNSDFYANSVQCCEDACEVWIECKCTFDPSRASIGSRFEDIWGGVDKPNILMAIEVWNDLIREKPVDEWKSYWTGLLKEIGEMVF